MRYPQLKQKLEELVLLYLGDDWMCHPDNQEYMPVEKTWGIMPLFGRCPAGLNFVYYLCHIGLIVPFLQLETVQR